MSETQNKSYAELRERSNELAQKFAEIKVAYKEAQMAARDQYCQETFQAPYTVCDESGGSKVRLSLRATGSNGRLLYQKELNGRHSFYVIREKSGALSGLLRRKPAGRWTEIGSVSPGLTYVW